MDTLNTLENKAKFFAQYFGQKIAEITMGSYTDIIEINSSVLFSVPSEKILKIKYKLNLKPLSKINNEDAIEAYKSIFGLDAYENLQNVLSIEKQLYEVRYSIQKSNHYLKYDFLRSKGYALPYMDLSINDLIEYGWIKLEE